MSPEKKTSTALWIVAVLSVITFLFVFFSFFTGQGTNKGVTDLGRVIAAQTQGAAVSSCRAEFSVNLVTAPQARTVKAIALYGYGSKESVDAASKIQEDEYQALASLAAADPKAFLKRCSGESGTKAKTCDDFTEPIPSTDDRYDPALDGDGDGIACE